MRLASRGSSSFQGFAKHLSDAVGVRLDDLPSLEGIVDFASLRANAAMSAPIFSGPYICNLSRARESRPSRPAPTTASSRSIAASAKLIDRDAERVRRTLEVAKRLQVPEVESEAGRFHAPSVHSRLAGPGGGAALGRTASVLAHRCGLPSAGLVRWYFAVFGGAPASRASWGARSFWGTTTSISAGTSFSPWISVNTLSNSPTVRTR